MAGSSTADRNQTKTNKAQKEADRQDAQEPTFTKPPWHDMLLRERGIEPPAQG